MWNIGWPELIMELALEKELEHLATELRAEIVCTLSKTGGHLSSSLGVVELTLALHHVSNTPDDKIIWDVGLYTMHGVVKFDRNPGSNSNPSPLPFHTLNTLRSLSLKKRRWITKL